MKRPLQSWIAHSWHRNRLVVQLTALVLLLLFVYLIPAIFIVIQSGEAGVLWRRFSYFGQVQAGTDTQHTLGEGVALKFPWDRIYIYNVRLQNARQEYDVLTKGGLPIKVQISVRFRPVEERLGLLHRYAGPNFRDVLVLPEIGSHARTQMAMLEPAEIYTSRRAEVERGIAQRLAEDLDVRYQVSDSGSSRTTVLRMRIISSLQRAEAPLTALSIARQLTIDDEDSIQEDLEALVRDDVLRQRTVDGKHYYRVNSVRSVNSDGTPADLMENGATLVHIEHVLIEQITLPEQIERAIQNKLVIEQQAQEYDFRLARERKEKERKRIEAEGIRLFQDIVAEGISDRYLRWKGIDATLELAKSENAKVVVIGNASDGLPLILGPLESGSGGGTSRAGKSLARRPPPASLTDNTPVGRIGTAVERAGTPTGAAGNQPAPDDAQTGSPAAPLPTRPASSAGGAAAPGR